jgi:uncharacterized protein YndB with AHSA1/START domain
MTESETLLSCVRVHRHFHACSTTVFDAFLRPEVARHFLFVTPAGRMTVAEVDVRIGGAFNFTDLRADGEVAHTGIYLEIDRPHRLAFTLSVRKYSADTDRIVLDFMPRGGGCDLTVTHWLQPHQGTVAERTQHGWRSILEALAMAIGCHAPAARATLPAPMPAAALKPARSPARAPRTSH